MDWYAILGIVAGVVLTIGIGFVKAIALANYAEDPTEEKRQRVLEETGDVVALVRKVIGR